MEEDEAQKQREHDYAEYLMEQSELINKEMIEKTFKGLDQEKFMKYAQKDPKLRAIWKSGSNKEVLMVQKVNNATG